ncbi:choice-of-anchor B family protein [Patiriisocius marinistellae]|nr:choice-of-anchor B family protein [Patiriisocius marinistellae]
MKKLLSFAFVCLSLSLSAQTPCSGGTAGPYPCDGYDLQSEISLGVMNASDGNDSWGWTDPSNGNEYAIVGLDNGTAFIDINNPTNPIYLGKLPTHTSSSTWRDIKVYSNHAFVVSEAGGHGMQVFDLTRLRNVTSPPVTFTEDAHFDGFGSAHNIVINEDTGYAYPVGASNFNGGPIFINIQDPQNPTAEGGYGMDSYSHDAQIITYCGPDPDYNGREILIGSNENEVIIADITDKSNPINISSVGYPNTSYTHQGWFTEDQSFFILGDEIDEIDNGFNTRTIIFDLSDLDNPSLSFEYLGPTAAIDHNGYTRGTKYYMANYRAGLRVIDVTDIASGSIVEEGFFDTYPNNDNASFSGAWSVYPYFDSGNIVISDINRGFILVKASTYENTPPTAVCGTTTISLDENGVATLNPADLDGGSTDNAGDTYFLVCDKFFDCSELGANTVELEVYDDFGNRDFCSGTVNVIDELAPILTCPTNAEVEFDAGQSFYTLPDYVTLGEVTANDNCTTGLSITQDPAAGTQLPQGNHFITFESTDNSGNIGTCMFQVAVEAPLNIEENDLNSGLILYPNPVSNHITVSSKNTPITSLQIVDILGKQLLNVGSISVKTKTIDVSQFIDGIYFIIVNNQISKKIIKN